MRRGDVTLWLTPDAIATGAAAGVGRRSGPLQSSDLAIETALPLSLLFHLPLRQTEGFLTSIFGMLGVDLTAPDHTTLSRRGPHLALALRRARPGTSLPLIVASTGLSIVGKGELAAATHGGRGRRGWRKLHLGVDGSRVIGACALTEPTADDAMTGISLVDEVDGHRTRVTADPADDTLACYGAAGARVVVPPTKTASLSRRGARSGARDRTIRRVKALGRRRWTQASGYHQHARVEHAFFRYTSIVGDCLRARSSSGPRREAVLACHVLNRMTELGRPVSYRIGRGRARRFEARRPARIRAPTPRRDDAPAEDHAGYRGEGAHHGDEHAEADRRECATPTCEKPSTPSPITACSRAAPDSDRAPSTRPPQPPSIPSGRSPAAGWLSPRRWRYTTSTSRASRPRHRRPSVRASVSAPTRPPRC